MPDPLSSDVVIQLRTDPTAALAASLILAASFPDLVSWAMRALSGRDCAKATEPKANGVGHEKAEFLSKPSTSAQPRKAAKPNGANGPHNPRESAAKHDEALLALMQANPHASVTELIRLSGRPRNSAMLSLERLERAGLVEHASRGKWIAVDPDLLEVPAPRPAGWLEPLSANRVAQHTAAMRVPDKMTTADA
jgi:Winged helix-turn-helix DNA-binding